MLIYTALQSCQKKQRPARGPWGAEWGAKGLRETPGEADRGPQGRAGPGDGLKPLRWGVSRSEAGVSETSCSKPNTLFCSRQSFRPAGLLPTPWTQQTSPFLRIFASKGLAPVPAHLLI